MCDTYLYQQGMFFWVDDMSEGTTNTVIPKKKRIWLVVSNNEINRTSANLTIVPVYTRDEAVKNTHVAFKNGDRNCVIVCEDIMTVPRYRIKPSNFAGMCSPELWTKVHKAILSQFKNEVTLTNVSDTVTSLITNEEFKNTIVEAIVNLYNKQPTNTQTTIKVDTPINTTISTTRVTKPKINDVNVNIKATGSGRKPNSKIMDTETSKQYLADTNTMSRTELNKKYAAYGNVTNDTALKRRIAYIKTKLKHLGVIVG